MFLVSPFFNVQCCRAVAAGTFIESICSLNTHTHYLFHDVPEHIEIKIFTFRNRNEKLIKQNI